MCRLESIFEIGQGPHISRSALARRCIVYVSSTQMPNGAREETFGRAHYQKRKMRNVVSETSRKTTYFIEEKCTEIYVGQDKFNTYNVLIETRAKSCEDSRAATLFVSDECKETDEEHERRENKEEVRHGD